MVFVFQVIIFVLSMEQGTLIRNIEKTTSENKMTLTAHGDILESHQKSLESILNGMFSEAFASKIRDNLNAKK